MKKYITVYAIYGEKLYFGKSNILRVKPTHCEQKYILCGKISIFVSPIQCLKNQRTMKKDILPVYGKTIYFGKSNIMRAKLTNYEKKCIPS